MAAAASPASASAVSAPSPLVSMVSLRPCGHTINEKLAKSIYGGTNDQGLVREPGHCPFPYCKRIVTSYLLDAVYSRALRDSLDSEAGGMQPEASKAIQAEQKDIMGVPFPGVKADFAYHWPPILSLPSAEEDFNDFNFNSETLGSLFLAMKIRCDKKNIISVTVWPRKNQIAATIEYFKAIGLPTDDYDIQIWTGFQIDKQKDLEIFCKVFAHNNTIVLPSQLQYIYIPHDLYVAHFILDKAWKKLSVP